MHLGAELHHKQASLYDGIGGVLVRAGEKGKAIQYFKKALEVDPNFDHAKGMLRKLSP